MPRFSLSGFGSEVKEAEAGSFEPYDGPLPPKNTLARVKVKQLKLKLNKNEQPMLNCVVEIDMPEGHKDAKYNGCPAWWNGNITKESAGFVNAFLRSIAGSEEKAKKVINDFWDRGLNLVGDSKPNKAGVPIGALGSLKIDPDKTLHGYILTKTKKNFQDKSVTEMDVASWVLPKSAIEGPVTDDDGEEIDEVEEEDGDEGSSGGPRDDQADEDDEDDGQYSDEPPF